MKAWEASEDEGWEDDLDGPPECIHANNICVTHVETLSRSLSLAAQNVGWGALASCANLVSIVMGHGRHVLHLL